MSNPPQDHIESDLVRRFEAGEARLMRPPKPGFEDARECRAITRTYGSLVGVLIADAPAPALPVTSALGPTLHALWRQTLGQMPVEDLRLIVALGLGQFASLDLRICATSGSLIATRWKPLFASESHLENPHA